MAAESSDVLLARFVRVRELRDKIRADRDACFCLRAEPVTPTDMADAASEAHDDVLATFEFPQPTQAEPCWKAARKWEDDGPHRNGGFRLDPPISEWCEPCRQRQALTQRLRAAVNEHGGALRGLIRRGRALARKQFDQ
jgi:hypothetical protein